jgi:hypothetical protein
MSTERPQKIFNIGCQRTGVTSIRYAFDILGYKCKLDGGTWSLVWPTERSLLFNENSVELKEYDAFSDNPLPLIYKRLDKLCPGSKFILTLRNKEGWLRSVRRLFEWGEKAWDELEEGKLIHATHRLLYGTTRFDENIFGKAFDEYNTHVQHYFKDRPNDFVVIDIDTEFGWNKLCAFLDKPIPSVPFPHKNRTK